MTNTMTSTAMVPTDRPARYGKQLTSHMGHKAETTWTDDGHGTIEMGSGTAVLECVEDGLKIVVTAPSEEIDSYESVVGRHLVMFGKKEELVATWQRSDGTRGTEQRSA